MNKLERTRDGSRNLFWGTTWREPNGVVDLDPESPKAELWVRGQRGSKCAQASDLQRRSRFTMFSILHHPHFTTKENEQNFSQTHTLLEW